MKLTGLYRLGRGKRIRHEIAEEYRTKQDFRRRIQLHGFRCVGVLTDGEVAIIKREDKEVCYRIYEKAIVDYVKENL